MDGYLWRWVFDSSQIQTWVTWVSGTLKQGHFKHYSDKKPAKYVSSLRYGSRNKFNKSVKQIVMFLNTPSLCKSVELILKAITTHVSNWTAPAGLRLVHWGRPCFPFSSPARMLFSSLSCTFPMCFSSSFVFAHIGLTYVASRKMTACSNLLLLQMLAVFAPCSWPFPFFWKYCTLHHKSIGKRTTLNM